MEAAQTDDPFAEVEAELPEGVEPGELQGTDEPPADDPFEEPEGEYLEDPEVEAEGDEEPSGVDPVADEQEPEPEADPEPEPEAEKPEEEPEPEPEAKPKAKAKTEEKPKPKRRRRRKGEAKDEGRSYVLLFADPDDSGKWSDRGTVKARNEEMALRMAFEDAEETAATIVVIPERYFRARKVKAEMVKHTKLSIE